MPEIVLTDLHNGVTVRVAPGDTVVIRLPDNPTTGYRWQTVVDPGLVLAGDDFSAGSSAAGAGGTRSLRFAARTHGAFEVRASLRRKWESGGAAQAEFLATIEVG